MKIDAQYVGRNLGKYVVRMGGGWTRDVSDSEPSEPSDFASRGFIVRNLVSQP